MRQNYLTNAELLLELEQARLTKLTDPTRSDAACVSPRLAQCFTTLVKRYSDRANWRGYTWVEDMRSEAMLALLNGVLKFNPERSKNAFAYFTTAVRNSFIGYLATEQRHRDIRDDLYEHLGQMPSFARQLRNLEEQA